jgi:hypothetical protein
MAHTPLTYSLPWRVVDAGTEVLVSEHDTEAEAIEAWQQLQRGSFRVYRVQQR